jgi:hypothetical protein
MGGIIFLANLPHVVEFVRANEDIPQHFTLTLVTFLLE